MQKRQKIKSIALSAVICGALLGGALLSAAQGGVFATADSVSMAAIIGEKTQGVTVSTQQTTAGGEYTGLLLSPETATDSWSAKIDTVFSDTAEITYLLPDKFTAAQLPVSAYTGSGDFKRLANSFTVHNTTGIEIGSFVIFNEHYGYLAHTSAYMHNAIDDSYWIPIHHWDALNKVDYYAATTAQNELIPSMSSGRCLARADGKKSYVEDLSGQYIAPKFGYTDSRQLSKDTGYIKDGVDYGLEGMLTFDYDDSANTLTIYTKTFDVKGREFENTANAGATGNGQTITVGKITGVDLSAGYTVTVGSAAPFGKPEDVHYFEHTHSSSVLLTTVNLLSLAEEELTVKEAKTTISYDGEYKQSGENVIELWRGERLQNFKYRNARTVKGVGADNVQLLGGYDAVAFDYPGNKAFTQTEQITVSYNGVSKTYTVKVLVPTLSTDKLITGENLTKTAAQTLGSYTGLKLASADEKKAAFSGTFKGNNSLRFVSVFKNGLVDDGGHAFVVKTTAGESVLAVVSYPHLTSGDGGRAYLYDFKKDKYFAPSGSGAVEITTFAQANGGVGVLPNYATADKKVSVNGTVKTVADNAATLSFAYNESTQKFGVSITTLQITGESNAAPTLSLGEVQADLSGGYQIEIVNACDLTQGNLENAFTQKGGDLYLLALNSAGLQGATVSATDYSKSLIYSGETVGDNGVVGFGEQIRFTSGSVLYLDNFGYTSQEITLSANSQTPGVKVVTATDFLGASAQKTVEVKTLAESLKGVSMRAGAQARSVEPYGLRFTMTVTDECKANIAAAMQDTTSYYKYVYYGMVIMPYSYLSEYGEVNADTLFGRNAVYKWDGKAISGTESATLLHRRVRTLQAGRGAQYNETVGQNYMYFAVENISKADMKTLYVAIGYVEIVRRDNVKEYAFFSLSDSYSAEEGADNSANNVRSLYDVAKATYEDTTRTDEAAMARKAWMLEHYLLPCGYQIDGE